MREVICAKYKEEMEGLEQYPSKTDMGRFAYEKLSKKAWLEWTELKKKIINEEKLNLVEKTNRDLLTAHFYDFVEEQNIHDQFDLCDNIS